jgi:hypothetical protein
MYIHYKLLELCHNNVTLYKEYIQNIIIEYHHYKKELINSIKENSILAIRQTTHKILGIIAYLEKTNELIYLCKIILLYDKTSTFDTYKQDIENLINYDIYKIIL